VDPNRFYTLRQGYWGHGVPMTVHSFIPGYTVLTPVRPDEDCPARVHVLPGEVEPIDYDYPTEDL